MAQSPCFLLSLPIPSLHSFLFPFTYLETLLGVIGSRPPWSQVTRELTSPFSAPPHPLPIPNSQYPRLTVRRHHDSASHGPEHFYPIQNWYDSPFKMIIPVNIWEPIQNFNTRQGVHTPTYTYIWLESYWSKWEGNLLTQKDKTFRNNKHIVS